MAARLLLRQAAASALRGRGQEAFEGVRMAESLARCARLVSDAEHGMAEAREALLGEAKRGLEDDPDYTPPGWHDGEEARALRETILAGLRRQSVRRGRRPPERLPLWFMLEDSPAMRPLAEALGLVVEGRAWVECPDFEAAVEKARDEGRGEAVDRALSEPVPIEHCVWLDDEERAVVLAREAAEGAEIPQPAHGAAWAGGGGWTAEPGEDDGGSGADEAAGPAVGVLDHRDEPWRSLPRRPRGIGEPARSILA